MPLTKHEAAVISAYTGFLMGNFADMQEYAEKILDRPIWTHQFADRALAERLKQAAKPDFLKICAEIVDLEKPRVPKLKGLRDGETFDPRRDYERLNQQMRDVWDVMKDGKWRTLPQLAEITGGMEASLSARLRDFRKPKFGGLTVEKQHLHDGLWEYRLVLEDE